MRKLRAVLIAGALFAAPLTLINSTPAAAVVTDSAPNQDGCTYPTGSASPLWGTGSLAAINRPVVATMSINGQNVPTGDIVNPPDHHIGVAICAAFGNARKVGLNLVQRDGINYKSDLTGAQLPNNAAYSTSMPITITLTNLGTNAPYYTYSTVHGGISSWTTSGLGTGSAALSFTITPKRIPLIDANDPGAGFCSATPPICDAAQSRIDITGANLYMDMDPDNPATAFAGSYFALDSAVGGFVTPSQPFSDGSRSIVATLGAPHNLADGVTPNVGSMQAYLPNSVLANLLNVDPVGLDTTDLAVSRTDGGSAADAPFTVTPTAGGAVVGVSNITFSSPVYRISNAASGDAPGGPQSGGGGAGYRMFAADGGVFNYGEYESYGSAASLKLAKPIVGGASTFSGQGYYEVASDGGVFAYGDAKFYGSAATLKLAKPIVGMQISPTGKGYYLVASDGGVFAYGDAVFYGSAGGIKLAKPVVGIQGTTTGKGYWLVASDGGVFSYGDAPFYGSPAALKLAKPVVGISTTSEGKGYVLVAADGGIFAYGDGIYLGGPTNVKLAAPIVGMINAGSGYALVSADGGFFNYGEVPFLGSAATLKLAKPIVAVG